MYIVPKILKPPTKSVFLSNSMKGPKICEYFAPRQILYCLVYSKKVKLKFYLPSMFLTLHNDSNFHDVVFALVIYPFSKQLAAAPLTSNSMGSGREIT